MGSRFTRRLMRQQARDWQRRHGPSPNELLGISVYADQGSVRIYLRPRARRTILTEIGLPIWWKPQRMHDSYTGVTRYGWLIFAVGLLP